MVVALKYSPNRSRSKSPRKEKKAVPQLQLVVLDLDETLIHAVTKEEMASLKKAPSRALKMHQSDDFFIYERPCLRSFLKKLSKHYTLAVWTAASDDYAAFVVKNILEPHLAKGAKFAFVFSSAHCNESTRLTGVLKHLGPVAPNLRLKESEILLIDDNPEIRKQKCGVITIPKFELDRAGHTKDKELKAISERLVR